MSNYFTHRPTVAIGTDLESDDCISLVPLLNEAKATYDLTGNYPIKLFVVGKGDAATKVVRMNHYIAMWKESGLVPAEANIIVAKANDSDKPFLKDGHELLNASYTLQDLHREIEQVKQSHHIPLAEAALTDFISLYDAPAIIQLKPAETLLEIAKKAPELIEKTEIAFYGSFNFRAIFEKSKIKEEKWAVQEQIKALTVLAKKTALYERFFSSETPNAIEVKKAKDKATAQGLAFKLEMIEKQFPLNVPLSVIEKIQGSSDIYLKALKKLFLYWNECQLENDPEVVRDLMLKYNLAKEETCLELYDILRNPQSKVWDAQTNAHYLEIRTSVFEQLKQFPKEQKDIAGKIERKIKKCGNIQAAGLASQVVHADTGLIAALCCPEEFERTPFELDFDREYGYTKDEPLKSKNSTVHMFRAPHNPNFIEEFYDRHLNLYLQTSLEANAEVELYDMDDMDDSFYAPFAPLYVLKSQLKSYHQISDAEQKDCLDDVDSENEIPSLGNLGLTRTVTSYKN